MVGNPYHDADGKFTSKNGMSLAILDLRRKLTQIIAKDPAKFVNEIIDISATIKTMTSEYEQYSGEDFETGKPKALTVPASIVAEAKQLALIARKNAKTSNTVSRDADGLITEIVMSDDPNWAPAPAFTTVNGQAHESRGSLLESFQKKYEDATGKKSFGYLPPKVIAAQVRADIKEAVAGGYVPKELDYSVQVRDAHSWSPSVAIEVRGLSDSAVKIDDGKWYETAKARELKDRLMKIVDQYRFASSDGFDNYVSNIQRSVSIEDKAGKTDRINQANQIKEAKVRQNKRVAWLATIDKNNPDKLVSTFDEKVEFNGTSGYSAIGREPKTGYYFYYRKDASGGTRIVEGYDLGGEGSKLSSQDEIKVMESIMRERTSHKGMGKIIQQAKFSLVDGGRKTNRKKRGV